MKRQLIAALLALNVAAVAVPSATFTVNAADPVVAQEADSDDDNKTPQQRLTEAIDAANADLTTKLNKAKDANDSTYGYNDAVRAKAKSTLEDYIGKIDRATTTTQVTTLKAEADAIIADLMDTTEEDNQKANVDNHAKYGTAHESDFYDDTWDDIEAASARVKAALKDMTSKKDAADTVSDFETAVKDCKTKDEIRKEYYALVNDYKADVLDKNYGSAGRKQIKDLKDVAIEKIGTPSGVSPAVAGTVTKAADVVKAYNDMKTAIDAVPTMDQEDVEKDLQKKRDAKKAELDKYAETKLAGSYTNVQKGQIRTHRDDGKTAIQKAKSEAEIEAAYNAAVSKIDSVMTKEEAAKLANEVIAQIKAIGDVTALNYNDKYATIKSVNDNYNKLEAGSEGKGKVDADNSGATIGLLTGAKNAYDARKVEEMTGAYKVINEDITAVPSKLTFENRDTYKGKIDKLKEDFATLFTPANASTLKGNIDALDAAYKAALTNHIATIKANFDTAIADADVAAVIAGTKEVTDDNRAKVEAAIKLYNEVAELSPNDNWLTMRSRNTNYKKLVDKLKAYTDKQEAAAAKFDLTKASVEVAASVEYTGSELRPDVIVKDADGVVIASTDYITAYDNNVNVGKSTVTVLPKAGSKYVGSISKEFAITAKAMTTSNTKVTVENLYYRSGKARNSVPVVKVDGREIARNTDFEVSYKNNVNVGAATVIIKGVGNYEGTVSASYAIMPEKAKITSLKAGTKKFTVKAVQEKGAKYQVAYKVKGASKYKTVTTSSVSKTVKGLKKGKTYSVKVRAYQTINGKKYLGNYSNVKNVKVK